MIGKAVSNATRFDIEEVCGVRQLCAGIRAGIEGAIHALNDVYDDQCDDGWGVLMVHASNTFNSVNQIAAL